MPARIGKYEIRGELGRGASGVVYHGLDPFVQREVAIKLSRREPAVAGGGTLPDRQAFFVEARAAGRLQHPHIVSLFDAGIEGDFNYLVMEYVAGETLRRYCRPQGPRMPLAQVVDLMFKCSKALDYAHRRGVLHRDIKPGNIMLDAEGTAKIMDFSVARLCRERSAGDSLESEGLVGSPLYMAPEQIERQPLGPATDLYALGGVAYALLAGEPPFRADSVEALFAQILLTPAPPLRGRRPELPTELCDIIGRLLHKNPQQRYRDGQQLAGDLTRLFDDLRHAGERISRRENRDSLRELSFFSSFADGEIDEILDVSSLLSFRAGDTIIEEGDIDASFYIVVLGSVEVRKSGQLLQTLGRGDCFGEIGFLTRGRRTASIIAAGPVAVLKASATRMQQVSRDCQLRYYKVFAENLIYRLSFTSARLAALGQEAEPVRGGPSPVPPG